MKLILLVTVLFLGGLGCMCSEKKDTKLIEQLLKEGKITDLEGNKPKNTHLQNSKSFIGIELKNLKFKDIDFSGINFTGANFSASKFENVNFNNANLKGSTFINTEIKNSTFIEADFSGVNAQSMKGEVVNFTAANLDFSNFNQAQFNSIPNKMNLATVKSAQFKNVDLRGVDLTGVSARLDDVKTPGISVLLNLANAEGAKFKVEDKKHRAFLRSIKDYGDSVINFLQNTLKWTK